MADKKISQLELVAGSTVAADDFMPFVTSGLITKRVKVSELVDAAGIKPALDNLQDQLDDLSDILQANPGAPVAVGTSGSHKTIVGLELTEGNWNVFATANFSATTYTPGSSNINYLVISLTDNGLDVATQNNIISFKPVDFDYKQLGPRRVSVAEGDTLMVYLVAYLTYDSAGDAAFGPNSALRAHRIKN